MVRYHNTVSRAGRVTPTGEANADRSGRAGRWPGSIGTGPVTLSACDDVMPGRDIDQILPHPGDPELREDYADDANAYVRLAERANGPISRRPEPGSTRPRPGSLAARRRPRPGLFLRDCLQRHPAGLGRDRHPARRGPAAQPVPRDRRCSHRRGPGTAIEPAWISRKWSPERRPPTWPSPRSIARVLTCARSAPTVTPWFSHRSSRAGRRGRTPPRSRPRGPPMASGGAP